jgi:hypothetical protein
VSRLKNEPKLDSTKQIHIKTEVDGVVSWVKWTNMGDLEIEHYAGEDGVLYRQREVIFFRVVRVMHTVEKEWSRDDKYPVMGDVQGADLQSRTGIAHERAA